jgi:alpha-1,3-glucan synthase
MMEKYPKRVFSKPEFTALPPFIFTGAEFALIPSRDEPFGLVAVEFGRKGALGVGARVGGLGQMPGWWFTVESTTTKHMLHQFKSAIEEALVCKTETRAIMRARSAKQRFPVAKWVEDLNTLQQSAIRIHNERKSASSKSIFRPRSQASASLTPLQFPDENFFRPQSRAVSTDRLSAYEERFAGDDAEVQESEECHTRIRRGLSLGFRAGPGHELLNNPNGGPLLQIREQRSPSRPPNIHEYDLDGAVTSSEWSSHKQETFFSQEHAEANYTDSERRLAVAALEGNSTDGFERSSPPVDTFSETFRGRRRSRSALSHESDDMLTYSRPLTGLLDPSSLPMRVRSSHHKRDRSSALDLSTIKNISATNFGLQKVDPTFEDKTNVYYAKFETMLASLSGKTSEDDLCVEKFLVDSEKEWFKRMRAERLGRGNRSRSRDSRSGLSPRPAWPRGSLHSNGSRSSSVSAYPYAYESDSEEVCPRASGEMDEFLLGANYQRPSILKRWLQTRIGDWPIYSVLLALGQIMAANSYQITLLTGPQGQSSEKLYIVGAIFIVMSCLWWIMFRTLPSKFVLSTPFVVYGTAFLFVGVAPFADFGVARDRVQNVATGLYVAASASGSVFFALNFGDEGEIDRLSRTYLAHTDLFRWCANQILDFPSLHDPRNSATLHHSTLLLGKHTREFVREQCDYFFTQGRYDHTSNSGRALCNRSSSYHISALLLPSVSGQNPVVMIVLQNYFLSTPYGRSWAYLWSSRAAPQWAVGLLVLAFFVVVWALFLFFFAKLSGRHSWFLPIFAIGLGAPRWAQMLWGVSGIGNWVPWMPGDPAAGALAGRSLWLWLGLLDSIQGVGFGMMLLQTLTRIHIAVSLVLAQILGTVVTMIAKATAPNAKGPGDVFPDFSAGVAEGLSKPWFWIGLATGLLQIFQEGAVK